MLKSQQACWDNLWALILWLQLLILQPIWTQLCWELSSAPYYYLCQALYKHVPEDSFKLVIELTLALVLSELPCLLSSKNTSTDAPTMQPTATPSIQSAISFRGRFRTSTISIDLTPFHPEDFRHLIQLSFGGLTSSTSPWTPTSLCALQPAGFSYDHLISASSNNVIMSNSLATSDHWLSTISRLPASASSLQPSQIPICLRGRRIPVNWNLIAPICLYLIGIALVITAIMVCSLSQQFDCNATRVMIADTTSYILHS